LGFCLPAISHSSDNFAAIAYNPFDLISRVAYTASIMVPLKLADSIDMLQLEAAQHRSLCSESQAFKNGGK
jgi:hypothetical protein